VSPTPEALAAIRAWYRFDRAIASFNRQLRSQYGLTGEQLSIARILGESDCWSLSELRQRLTMHPATLGQALARLQAHGLVDIWPDQADGRRRMVRLTDQGREVIGTVPLVGPVRLRTMPADPDQLALLTQAFTLAVDIFGFAPYAGDPRVIDTSHQHDPAVPESQPESCDQAPLPSNSTVPNQAKGKS